MPRSPSATRARGACPSPAPRTEGVASSSWRASWIRSRWCEEKVAPRCGCAGGSARGQAVSGLAGVETEQRGTRCIVTVRGEIDLSNAKEIFSAIELAISRDALDLVVDLSP